jgi:lipid-binding SYLF domain-containing protein
MSDWIVWFAVLGSLVPLSSPTVLSAQQMSTAASREEQVVALSTTVLDEVMAIPANSIPRTLLANAQAVAIVPNVVKGGFVVGVRHGRGVVLIRDDTRRWQAPLFVTLNSGSIGWQAGIQATDLIMVFQTRQSVNALLNGRLTVGVDAAAAAGPVGRQATAATDTSLSAEILSYSRSRGLFAGFALDGASIQIDNLSGARFYAHNAGATDLPPIPPSATALVHRVAQYSGAREPAAAAVDKTATAGRIDVEPVRQQLDAAWRRLALLLDANWRTYLQLPGVLLNDGNAEDASAMMAALQHYETVAADQKFAALTQRPEFTATHQLLRQYVGLQRQANAAWLSLPPPPQSVAPSTR